MATGLRSKASFCFRCPQFCFPLSLQVLSCYRSLHRTRLKVFKDDTLALEAGRQRIRNEFLKHKSETDPSKITELISMAESAEKFLRCNVVQGVETDRRTFSLRITEDTELLDNAKRPCKNDKWMYQHTTCSKIMVEHFDGNEVGTSWWCMRLTLTRTLKRRCEQNIATWILRVLSKFLKVSESFV